jgi:uncharacterized protein
MLIKILLFGGVLFLIYLFFFKTKRQESVKRSESNTKKNALEGETMVECHTCSTFISHKEAIIKDGLYYCSKECARLN